MAQVHISTSVMIFKYKDIDKLKKKLKGKKVVFTGGCFDLLHQGHTNFLKKVSRYGEELVVFIKSDEYIVFNKKRAKPVFPQKIRAQIIDSLKSVSHTVCLPASFKEEPPFSFLHNFQFSRYVTRSKKWEKFRKEMNKIGCSLVIINMPKANASGKIIKAIQNQNNS